MFQQRLEGGEEGDVTSEGQREWDVQKPCEGMCLGFKAQREANVQGWAQRARGQW